MNQTLDWKAPQAELRESLEKAKSYQMLNTPDWSCIPPLDKRGRMGRRRVFRKAKQNHKEEHPQTGAGGEVRRGNSDTTPSYWDSLCQPGALHMFWTTTPINPEHWPCWLRLMGVRGTTKKGVKWSYY